MNFENKIQDKGDKESEGFYESVTIDGVTLSVGDVVVWSNPDAGMHTGECELIHTDEWVVEVRNLYKKWDEHNEEWRLRIGNSGVGWIEWDEIAIPGEKGNFTMIPEEAESFVASFKESDYEKYMYRKYHTGEDGCPEELWEIYENQSYGNSGPHCEYCTGDGIEIDGN